jgi:hypothetical protein
VALERDTVIISWDPGVTTGLVIVRYIGGTNFDVLRAEEVKWADRFSTSRNTIASYSQMTPRPIIVCESFYLRADEASNQVGSDFPSCQLIGIIECWCYEFSLGDRFYKQNPDVKSRTGILERHYNLVKSPRDHMKDAYQHARYFIVHEVSKSRGRR